MQQKVNDQKINAPYNLTPIKYFSLNIDFHFIFCSKFFSTYQFCNNVCIFKV